MVLYVSDKKAVDRIVIRLEGMGYHPVSPENPYWKEKGVTGRSRRVARCVDEVRRSLNDEVAEA